ncbi:MAG: histidine phosphatase family protein [Planctomycetota bacterium]
MKVYLARHAWAGHYGDTPPANGSWTTDSERPLTPEGVKRYRRLVRLLADRGFAPERIATSPYARCRQTAELIAEATGGPPIDELEALAPGADLDALSAWSAHADGESLCWVGHNPCVERLAAQLIGDGYAAVRFAKGSIAAVRFDGPPTPREGVLEWHLTAKLLGV